MTRMCQFIYNNASRKVVYSREEAKTPMLGDLDRNGRRVPASISYVPATAGLVMAEAVIASLLRAEGSPL